MCFLIPTCAVRETNVSWHNGGTSGAPLKPLRDDSALKALSSLRGFRGAPEVPPLCRETSVSRIANVGTWLRKRNGGQKWVKECQLQFSGYGTRDTNLNIFTYSICFNKLSNRARVLIFRL